MSLTLCRDNVVEFLKEVSDGKFQAAEGAGLHTVPELLLIVELVGDLKFHRSMSAFPAVAHDGPEVYSVGIDEALRISTGQGNVEQTDAGIQLIVGIGVSYSRVTCRKL